SLTKLMHTIKERFGSLQGVIHSAGVIHDSLILKKTPQEVDDVFAPKILGAVHLDEATQSEPLDFFVMFSSLAAIFGNIGQSDYA
ncbi:ketoreductase domain-containing protein, partial [Klebsiella pneumoniae]|nr:ketoreductase domain-containing protein [Klebsiella pneumoniae]